MFHFSQLELICNGKTIQLISDTIIEDIVIDSRKAIFSKHSIFFAISGVRHDGHDYLNELYSKGIGQFVVEKNISLKDFPHANFLLVKSSVEALQLLAAKHRGSFDIPVIAITGSNGKTIIKEWLYQLLSPELRIAKSPASFNSQIGAPLSVLQLNSQHQLGIFEAGISRPGEMQNLQKVIQPTHGIFTNIGTAHDEGFESIDEKIKEKLILFTDVKQLIYCFDHDTIRQFVHARAIPSISWGFKRNADVFIEYVNGKYRINWRTTVFEIILPFTDHASVENCMHCIVWMISQGYSENIIQERVSQLRRVAMRLELKQGNNNCQVIDDSYNNDLGGLRISLDFLAGIRKQKKTLVLSDILQSGHDEIELVNKIRDVITKSDISRLIGIGPVLSMHQNQFKDLFFQSIFYSDTEEALKSSIWSDLQNEAILVKGARTFHFEKIVAQLQLKVHGTRIEIDLNRIVQNLNFFKSRLNPGVKLMVMVKAFAYGSGSEEIATLLQYHRIDYLGVAYADEGIELRKKNITLPIMVMNATEESFQSLLDYSLEPVIYSLKMLRSFEQFLGNQSCTVHLEFDTGMKRLGLENQDEDEVVSILKRCNSIKVASIFSHLAGADEALHDEFTKMQVSRFEQAYDKLTSQLKIKPIRHILNSPGILRLSPYQMDMVRLGIGLYGINPTSENFPQLLPAAELKTVISQIKTLDQGETVGYGRRGKADHPMKLATIAIGYADGFNRIFSRGVGNVLVNGSRAKVIGNVCMDMTMIDITGIDAKEGDDVIIFGEGLPIEEVAKWANTIPYEILTNTSERVKRIFISEGN